MVVKQAAIGDIVGGHPPIERDIGDPITIQTIYDTYRWYPGFKAIIQLGVEVVWSNGLNEESILPDRLLELKDANEHLDAYGYSIVIVDGRKKPPTADAWHPEIDGIGFTYTKFSAYGDPLEVRIKMKTAETDHDKHGFPVPAYPCKKDEDGERILTMPIPGGYGFFSMRTRGGLKGVQGLPKYLDLIDPIRGQYDILKAYIPYAEKQGLAHPALYLKDNSPTNRAQVKADFKTQPQKDRLVIMSTDDLLEYESPQQNAWDPWPILDWGNNMIARATQMNKLMLEGHAMGEVASTDSAISNWEAKVKELQVYLRTQFLPIFIALGGSEDTAFNDPSKPKFISLMEGIKLIRDGLYGLVANEDIIKLMNKHLELEGEDKLKVAPEDELENNNGDDKNGTNGDNEGDKTSKTKAD